MAKVYLICGRICSGKSTYAKKLSEAQNAVILSVDEIMLAVFGQDIGEKHDIYVKRLQAYLYQKSLDFIASGVNVILDFGFWTKQERANARGFFESRDVVFEFHYLNISQSEWKERIAKRNTEALQKQLNVYFVDEGLVKKFEELFEQPQKEEVHIWIEG